MKTWSRWGMIALVVSAGAMAQETIGSVRKYSLSYATEEDCPDAKTFASTLQKYAPAWEGVETLDARPMIVVRLTRGSAGGDCFANVELINLDLQTSKRELHTAKCEEAVEGAALIASVFLASLPEIKKPSEPTASATPNPTPSPPVEKKQWVWRSKPQLQVGWRNGVAPVGAPYVLAGWEVLATSESAFSPSVRAMAGYALSRSHLQTPALDFSAWLVRFDVCPLRFSFSALRQVAVQGCVLAEGGSMRAAWVQQGFGAKHAPWVAPGASGRLSWAVSREISVEGDFFAVRPLFENYFLLEDRTLFAVPKVSVGATVGLGWNI